MMKKVLFVSAVFCAVGASAAVCVKDGETVAFLGDSITAGGNSTPAGYVNLVMTGLREAGVRDARKIPAGIGGHKAVQMHARLDKDVLSKKPRWMTFSCGVNDVWHGRTGVPLEKYRTLVSDIFDRCAAANVEVIVLTATMIGEDADNENNRKLAAYNDWLRAEARRRGLRLADLNADMQAEVARLRAQDKTTDNKLTTDGVHMKFPGNCLMAWGVLRAMGVDPAMKERMFALFRRQPGAYRETLHLTAEEKEAFDALAAERKLSPSAYLRAVALPGKSAK